MLATPTAGLLLSARLQLSSAIRKQAREPETGRPATLTAGGDSPGESASGRSLGPPKYPVEIAASSGTSPCRTFGGASADGLPVLMSGGRGMSRNNRAQGGQPKPSPPSEQLAEPPPAPASSTPRTSDRTALYTLAGVIAASMFAFIGSQWVAKSAFDAEMVQIGVSILSADPSKSDVAPARDWAIRLVQEHSGQPFSEAERDSLLKHPIQTLPARPGFALSGVPCDALQHNADGSWTIRHAETVAGTFDTVRMAGSLETKLFDQFCGQDRVGSH
jgi:hypothetical protein